MVQFLARAPELETGYRNAPPEARAVIDAAMDARRLGIGVAVSHRFLEAAAPGYLNDGEWDGLGDDWLEQALAFTGAPCKGTAGPVTCIRPRPASGQAAGSAPAAPGARRTSWPTTSTSTAAVTAPFPPDEFWSAAAGYGSPGSEAALGSAARGRCLFQHAAQLRKNATWRFG